MTSARATIAAAACAMTAAGLLAVPAEAKVETAVVGKVLQVQGSDRSERALVTCNEAGEVKVNGDNPKGGTQGCAGIVEVDASMGAGNDTIDLSGVTGSFGEARFPGFGVGTGTAAVGGRGNDRYVPSPASFNIFFGEGGNDRATGGPARDVLSGGAGDDTLNGAAGRDSVLGEAGDDRLLGGNSGDLLSGGVGDDIALGGPGSDVLGGGPGRDRLRGGPGQDRLVGGAGRDNLSGGNGKDTEIEKDPKS